MWYISTNVYKQILSSFGPLGRHSPFKAADNFGLLNVGHDLVFQWNGNESCPRIYRSYTTLLLHGIRAVGTGPADPVTAGPIIWQAIIFMFTYQFSRTWFDSSRIYAIRCQILMLKCSKFDFRWGYAPDPLYGFKAPTSKGEAKMEGRGRMESGRKKWGPYYYERERRKWIGGREGKRKGFAGPMSKCFLRPCSFITISLTVCTLYLRLGPIHGLCTASSSSLFRFCFSLWKTATTISWIMQFSWSTKINRN